MNLAIFLAALFHVGCSDSSSPLTAPVEGAELYVAADLSGDGNDSLVAVLDDTIHWHDHQHAIDGGVLMWSVGKSTDSATERVVFVTGRSRTHPKAVPKIVSSW